MAPPVNHPHWREDPWKIELSEAPMIGRDGYSFADGTPTKLADGEDKREDQGWSLVQHIEDLIEFIAQPIGWLLEGVEGVIDFISPAFQAVFNGVASLLGDIANFVGGAIGLLFGGGSGEVGTRFSPFKDDIDGILAPYREILDANFLLIEDGLIELDAIQKEQEEQVRINEDLEEITKEAREAAEAVTTNLESYRTELLNAIGPELDRARIELEEAKEGLATREDLTAEIKGVGDAQEAQWQQMAEATFESFEGTPQEFFSQWRDQQIAWNDTQQLVNDKNKEWQNAADKIDDAQTAAIDAQQRILDMVFPAQSALALVPGTLTPDWYNRTLEVDGVTKMTVSPPSGAVDKEHFLESSNTSGSSVGKVHWAKVVPEQRYKASIWVRSTSSSSLFEVKMQGLNADGTVDINPLDRHVEVRPTLLAGGEFVDTERVVRVSTSLGFDGLGLYDFNTGTGWRKLERYFYFKEGVEQVAVKHITPHHAGSGTMRFGDFQIWPDIPVQADVDNQQNAVMRALEKQIEGVNDYLGKDVLGSARQNTLLGKLEENDKVLSEMQDEVGEFIPRLFFGTPGSSSSAPMGSELLRVNKNGNQLEIYGYKTASDESWVGNGVAIWQKNEGSSDRDDNSIGMQEITFRSGTTTTTPTLTNLKSGPVFIAWQMTKGKKVMRPATATSGTMNQNSFSTLATVNVPSNAEIEHIYVRYYLENANLGTEYRIGVRYGGVTNYHYTSSVGPLTPLGSGRRLMEWSIGRLPNRGTTSVELIAQAQTGTSSRRMWTDARIEVTYIDPA